MTPITKGTMVARPAIIPNNITTAWSSIPCVDKFGIDTLVCYRKTNKISDYRWDVIFLIFVTSWIFLFRLTSGSMVK